MATREISREQLQDYFDHFSTIMPSELVEIEVAGLELGDQIEAEWVPLKGISYDPGNDRVVVAVENSEHTVKAPADVVVDEDDNGIRSISIKCGEVHLHVLRLKELRKLPERD